MKKNILPLILFVFIAFSWTNNSGHGFSYQAVARTHDGQVLANEAIELRFSLYAGEEAQNPSYQETHQVLTNPFGIFQVVIGKGQTDQGNFSEINFGAADFWIKVEVKDNGVWQEISNSQLYPYPRALYADNAQAAPAGSIMPFAGPKDKIPEGWFLCDGRTLSRTEYADLYAIIGTAWGHGDGANTFHVPDLRGLFLRGVDNDAGRDPDKNNRKALNTGGNTRNAVGSFQDDMFKSHNHQGKTKTAGKHKHKIMRGDEHVEWGDGGGYSTFFIDAGGHDAGPKIYTDEIGAHTHDLHSDGGNETRPDNAYVNYIIKF